MTDEPNSKELSALLKKHDHEFEDWKQKRLQIRFWIFGISCLGLFVALTAWLHEVLRPVFCTGFGIVCQEYYTGNYWHLMSWVTVVVISASVMSLVAIAATTVVWFSRLSHRLHVRGPMIEAENRLAFLCWLAAVTTFFVISGIMSAIFLTLGR